MSVSLFEKLSEQIEKSNALVFNIRYLEALKKSDKFFDDFLEDNDNIIINNRYVFHPLESLRNDGIKNNIVSLTLGNPGKMKVLLDFIEINDDNKMNLMSRMIEHTGCLLYYQGRMKEFTELLSLVKSKPEYDLPSIVIGFCEKKSSSSSVSSASSHAFRAKKRKSVRKMKKTKSKPKK